MRRVLITGMSGTGKSTITAELARRGYRAVDIGEPEWSHHGPDGDWVWREDRVRELLREGDSEDVLIVSGCAANQVKFYAAFDHIVLLSAPLEVLLDRLQDRSNNSFGKSPEERAKVTRDLQIVEPRLRNAATHELDAALSVEALVDAVLELSDLKRSAGHEP